MSKLTAAGEELWRCVAKEIVGVEKERRIRGTSESGSARENARKKSNGRQKYPGKTRQRRQVWQSWELGIMDVSTKDQWFQDWEVQERARGKQGKIDSGHTGTHRVEDERGNPEREMTGKRQKESHC